MAALVLRGRDDGRIASHTEALLKRPNLLKGEDLTAEPTQARSQKKRSQLKAAALTLFGDKGYENTSIETISRRAKLPVGSFYQHFRSKRQLLLVLMDELLQALSRLNLQPEGLTEMRRSIHSLLSRIFATDLTYLGACRAWQEAALSDVDLAQKQKQIHAWTTARVSALFQALCRAPGARHEVNVEALAQAMDSYFWSLLSRALQMQTKELDQQIAAATHMIYHSLFVDPAK
jgi:AcrR family transcriptional regulator